MRLWTRCAAALCVSFIAIMASAEQASAQYCVRYVRGLTDIEIRGNAWSWWDNAAGLYDRGSTPAEGSVLVFRRGGGGMNLGHVSTVSAVVDDRTILVDHSFGGPVLWRDMPIIDVSPNNDWTSVRVWHGPTNQLGSTEFATYGFIYPHGGAPQSTPIADASATVQTGADHGLSTTLARITSAAVALPPPAAAPIDVASLVDGIPLPARRPEDRVFAVAPAAGPRVVDTTAAASGWLPPDVGALAALRPGRPPRTGAIQAADATAVQAVQTVQVRR